MASRVPEGLITVEVTVWHWEAYAAWHRMNETIHTALSARMLKRGVARNVRIELPIGSPQEAVEYLWSHEFCDRVCDTESGAIVTNDGAAPRPIRAPWRPMLHFTDHDRIDWAAVAANGGLPFSAGPNIGQSFGYSINPCISEDDRNPALESLRRSIDRKKRQRDPNVPHFLAIASTFPRIAGLGERVRQHLGRVWAAHRGTAVAEPPLQLVVGRPPAQDQPRRPTTRSCLLPRLQPESERRDPSTRNPDASTDR